MKTFLIDEPPLLVLPTLAKTIGLNEAIVLQQLRFLLRNPNNGKQVSGAKHIYNTYEQWHPHFPFFSVSTIKRTFRNLEQMHLIESCKPDRYRCDHRKYYRINDVQLDSLIHALNKSSYRVKGWSIRSHRRDQIDPAGTDQLDPSNIQRRRKAKNNPPTPGPSSGGSSSSSPGKKVSGSAIGKPTPGGSARFPEDEAVSISAAENVVRGTKRTWALEACSHPAADEFLALVGLEAFPAEGRQRLARAFVKATESDRITVGRLRLLSALRSRINFPATPEAFIRSFDLLVADARNAAQERLQEIGRKHVAAFSNLQELLKTMAAAEQQLNVFGAEDFCSPVLDLPFPWWLRVVVCIKTGAAIAIWKERCKPQILEELSRDPGVTEYLGHCGLGFGDLGCTEAEISEYDSECTEARERDRSRLEKLLFDQST